jgi:hypothetical protein
LSLFGSFGQVMGCCHSSKATAAAAAVYTPHPPTKPRVQSIQLNAHSASATDNTDYDDIFAEIEDFQEDSEPHTPIQSPEHLFFHHHSLNDDDNFGEIEDSAKVREMAADETYSSKTQRISEVRTLREQIERHGGSLANPESTILVQELAQVLYAKSRQCDAAFARKMLDQPSYLSVSNAIEETRISFEQLLAPNPDLLSLARQEMFSVVQVVPLTAASPVRTRGASHSMRGSLSISFLDSGEDSARGHRSRATSPAPNHLNGSNPTTPVAESSSTTGKGIEVFG